MNSRPVTIFDFHVKEKYTVVAPRRTHPCSRRRRTVTKASRFVDYAPFVFKKLRERFEIKNEDYIDSIGPRTMISSLMLGSLRSLSEHGSEGKSGSFFYVTADGKYLIKTVHQQEHKVLRRILPEYFKHMMEKEVDGKTMKNSLMTRILGCHMVRVMRYNKLLPEKIYLVVMNNVFNTELSLDYRFDLKGSTNGRVSSEEARTRRNTTLKDVDFTLLEQGLKLTTKKTTDFIACVKRDAAFLEKMGLIDYSLLVGVHVVSEEDKAQYLVEHVRIDDQISIVASRDGSEIYFLGVLDFLTPYSSRKVLEQVFKTVQTFDPIGISVQRPWVYSKRFMNFMRTIVK